jgi:SAM-dependent methyltransferase
MRELASNLWATWRRLGRNKHDECQRSADPQPSSAFNPHRAWEGAGSRKRAQASSSTSASVHCGQGIEIGPLHNPMPVDARRASVQYVDRLSLEEQRRHYPELDAYALVNPDMVAEADQLHALPDGSQDFVIANHVLEHLSDPTGALKEWHRVLRSEGVLFLALPDKRRTFDRDRPRTTLGHLIADHRDRGAASRHDHYVEYSRLVHNKSGDELENDVANLMASDDSIHLHVWISEDIAESLDYARNVIGLCWTILEQAEITDSDEFIYVLQKTVTDRTTVAR